jgi:hypothetical protein
MVVVTALGSSVLPMGAGSTYLRTVMSVVWYIVSALFRYVGLKEDGLLWHTLLLVDLHLDVEVDAGNDQVADHVEGAHAVQDVRVLEGHLLAGLHHHQDNDEVGAGGKQVLAGVLAQCLQRILTYIWGFIAAVLSGDYGVCRGGGSVCVVTGGRGSSTAILETEGGGNIVRRRKKRKCPMLRLWNLPIIGAKAQVAGQLIARSLYFICAHYSMLQYAVLVWRTSAGGMCMHVSNFLIHSLPGLARSQDFPPCSLQQLTGRLVV